MTTRRLLVAGFSATAGLLLLSPGAFADARGQGNSQPTQTSATPATSRGSDRDVRGAAVDPSKKDFDNGAGNNCDPGFGRGNQAKFGMASQSADSGNTSCPTRPSGQSEAMPAAISQTPEAVPAEAQTAQPASNTKTLGTMNANAPAIPASAGVGGVLANTAIASGIAAVAAPAVQRATGAVLAATGIPVAVGLVGLVLLAGGVVLAASRLRA